MRVLRHRQSRFSSDSAIVFNVRVADAVGLDYSLPYEPRRMLSAETIATGIIPSKNNNTMIGKN